MLLNLAKTADFIAAADEFDDELETDLSLPHLQVINAGGKNLKKLESDPYAYGLVLSSENAEKAGFVPTEAWVEGTDIAIHPNSPNTISHGYVSRSMNAIVLAQSDLEVEKNFGDTDNPKWRFIGVQYKEGKITKEGQEQRDEKDSKPEVKIYRLVRRYLLLLLDENLQPMHEKPLGLKAKGLFGISLNEELTSFHQELGMAYKNTRRNAGHTVKGGRFTRSAQAYCITPMEFGPRIPKDAAKAASTVVVGRYQPVEIPKGKDASPLEGQTSEIERQEHKVKVTAVSYNKLQVGQTSELGKLITQYREEFDGFELPNRGRDADAESDGSAPFSGQGHLDASTLVFNTDGTVQAVFDDGTARHPVMIPEQWAGTTDGELVIDGIIPADGGPVQVTRVQVVEHAAPVPVGAVPAGVSF